jgi:type IV pilus biogenesis protein CpaD/CtpE
MTHFTKFMTLFLATATLNACTQTTPSMMNENKPRLITQSNLDQRRMSEVNDHYLSVVAEHYNRYGEGPLSLTASYDPKSKSYTAMKAVNDLSRMTDTLRLKGIQDVATGTLPVEGGEPSLSVSYDMVTATGPKDCAPMPGMDTYETSRFMDEGYRFGCGIETQLARQIYRPADLKGRGTRDAGDGRRAVNLSEYYRAVSEEEVRAPLETLEREDLQSE